MKQVVLTFSLLMVFLNYGQSNHNQLELSKVGEMEIMFSFPYVNHFYIKPKDEGVKSQMGFWGISVGIGYQYAEKSFANVVVSGQLNAELPIPVARDYENGVKEFQYSSNISLMNNHQIKKWIVSYGISFSQQNWHINYYGDFYNPPTDVNRSYTTNSLGVNVGTYFCIFKNFNVGILYRPNFLMLKPETKWHYQHSISLDIAFRFRIKLKK